MRLSPLVQGDHRGIRDLILRVVGPLQDGDPVDPDSNYRDKVRFDASFVDVSISSRLVHNGRADAFVVDRRDIDGQLILEELHQPHR